MSDNILLKRAVALLGSMSFNKVPPGSVQPQGNMPRDGETSAAGDQAAGFAKLLHSIKQSINRNMEPFSEGLHKVVDGNADKDAGYESGSEASVSEVKTKGSKAIDTCKLSDQRVRRTCAVTKG